MSKPYPDRKILLTHLASATGRNVAIYLQELHYATKSQHKKVWRGSYDYWQREHFPLWSLRTTEKTIHKAEEMGLVYSLTEKCKWYDNTRRTKSYGINYKVISYINNQTGTLLLHDIPLNFSSTVATLFAQTPGLTLNDAFVLFEIRYWLKAEEMKYQRFACKHVSNGHFWDLKRFSDFQTRLPFMCRRTIERSIKRLREAGCILTERTSLGTLAFTIVVDKMNGIEGLSEGLKAPEPPPVTGRKALTKFYAEEYTIRGYDLYYIVATFNRIGQDGDATDWVHDLGLLTDGSEGQNKQANRNLDTLRAIVREIGKHKLMDDIRDTENCSDMFAEGDWDGYADYVNERIENAATCDGCQQEYYERYGCVCGYGEKMEVSYA